MTACQMMTTFDKSPRRVVPSAPLQRGRVMDPPPTVRPPRAPAFSAAPDTRPALDLFDLVVWAIRDQRADADGIALHGLEAEADGDEPSGQSRDGVATMMARGRLGCVIDGGGPVRGVAPRVHDDAEEIAAAIRRLGDGPWARRWGMILVLKYARLGVQPDWLDEVQPLEPVPAGPGGGGRGRTYSVESAWEPCQERHEIVYTWKARGERIVDAQGRSRIDQEEKGFAFDRAKDGRRILRVTWCPIVPRFSRAEVEQTNREYADWHSAMRRLIDDEGIGRLRTRRAAGFSAPARPWEVG